MRAFFILLSFSVISAKAAEPTLGERLIATLPKAEAGEFESAEAVAKAITDALIEDDWDSVVRATTIRLRCELVTFEATAHDLGSVQPVRSADPSAPLAQFLAHFQNIQAFRQIQLSLAGEPEPSATRPLEIDRKAPDPAALAALKESTLYKRPAGLKLLTVKTDLTLSKKMWELSLQKREPVQELGAEDAAYVEATVTGVPGGGEFSITYIVLKIGSNWLVDNALLP